MLLAGILTFSVAFFFILLAYATLRFIKNIGIAIVVLLILFGSINYIQNTHFSNPTLELQRQKVELLLSGSDLRTTKQFDMEYEIWQSEGNLLWGYGGGYMNAMLQDDLAGSSSVKRVLVDYGIIGFLLFYVPLLSFSIYACQTNISAIIYVVVYFLSFYQRPNWYSTVFVTILFAGIAYIRSREQSNQIEAKTEKANV